MKKQIRKAKDYLISLPLDKQIHNEVLLILSLIAIITGFENFLVNLPTWYGVMFIVAGFIAISLVFLNYYLNWYRFSKVLTILIMYSMTILGWLFNGGLDGPALLFIGAIMIFSVGFYLEKFLALFLINVLTLSSLVLLNYFFPVTKLNTYNTESERVIDVISSYLLITVSIIMVLYIVLKNYNRARKTVTEQKSELETLNTELKEANEELVYLNASKDKLFSIIAHDLRSPLSSLVGYSELLAESIPDCDKEKIRDSVLLINKTHNKTLDLLEDLLLWSKSQSGTLIMSPEKTDIGELCNEIMDEKRGQAMQKNIEMESFLVKELLLYSDRYMLKTILRNMISNAIKFTGIGGKITIHSETDGSFEKIMVSDNGTGMTEEVKVRLWDIRNQQTNPGTEGESGSGLGLILCKDFVEKHGGSIWVESEPGNGSRFFFTMPKYSEPVS